MTSSSLHFHSTLTAVFFQVIGPGMFVQTSRHGLQIVDNCCKFQKCTTHKRPKVSKCSSHHLTIQPLFSGKMTWACNDSEGKSTTIKKILRSRLFQEVGKQGSLNRCLCTYDALVTNCWNMHCADSTPHHKKNL